MIFDSQQMVKLSEKYRTPPDFRVPFVVLLDRRDDLAGERQILEYLYTCLPPTEHKEWLGKFVNKDAAQHTGAWFELLLFGWLKQHFPVQFQPQVMNCDPDFIVNADGKEIVIEAKAFLLSPEERNEDAIHAQLDFILSTIKKPYAVNVNSTKTGIGLDERRFKSQMIDWLENSREEPLIYEDDFGNSFELTVGEIVSGEEVLSLIGSPVYTIDTDVLKKPLKDKAKQHSEVRYSNHPYIIAIYLESWKYQPHSVVDAWFGKTQTIVNIESKEVIRHTNDYSGNSFYRNEVLHTSVSGILVYKYDYNESGRYRFLRAWYIENPYATVKVDPMVFPVEGRFIVTGRDDKNIQMQWQK